MAGSVEVPVRPRDEQQRSAALRALEILDAHKLAERARKAVAEMQTDAGRVTVSAGVVQGNAGADPLKLADGKLYEAKRTGRKRVCG